MPESGGRRQAKRPEIRGLAEPQSGDGASSGRAPPRHRSPAGPGCRFLLVGGRCRSEVGRRIPRAEPPAGMPMSGSASLEPCVEIPGPRASRLPSPARGGAAGGLAAGIPCRKVRAAGFTRAPRSHPRGMKPAGRFLSMVKFCAAPREEGRKLWGKPPQQNTIEKGLSHGGNPHPIPPGRAARGALGGGRVPRSVRAVRA